ncbi:MAG: GAF domain-containing protein, partial [Proteobacteria bacterium]|nr:GAF domain-containing protein [Pseudomonadota bacterium]
MSEQPSSDPNDARGGANRIALLEGEINCLRQADILNQTLLEISNAVTTTLDLGALYASIHKSLSRLIYMPNFYICIYDREKNLLHFPYYKDEKDTHNDDALVLFEKNSLTGEVIINKKSLFLDEVMLAKRYQEKRIQGSLPKIWIGVPLLSMDKVIGAIAIQNYTDPKAFGQKDMDILIQVSGQIAMAIERKQFHGALIESELRYRTLAEKSHDIIMRLDRQGRHLYVNTAIKSLGISPEQVVGKTHKEFDFSDALVEKWESAIARVFATEKVNRIEFKFPDGPWIDWMLCPEFNSDHEVVSVITF